MYGKVDKGILIYAPNTLLVNGKVHYHPSKELYQKMGFFPIVDSKNFIAENNKYYKVYWEKKDGKILKKYMEIEPPARQISVEEQINLMQKQIKFLSNNVLDTQMAVCEVYETMEDENG